MPRKAPTLIVNVCLTGSDRDYDEHVTFLHKEFRIVRAGTNGNLLTPDQTLSSTVERVTHARTLAVGAVSGAMDPTARKAYADEIRAVREDRLEEPAIHGLVVDDEEDIRELVSGVLEDEGYAVRTAADSSTALDAIEEIATVTAKKISCQPNAGLQVSPLLQRPVQGGEHIVMLRLDPVQPECLILAFDLNLELLRHPAKVGQVAVPYRHVLTGLLTAATAPLVGAPGSAAFLLLGSRLCARRTLLKSA